MECSFLFAKCSPQILRGETMFLTLRGSSGLRGRGQNGHSAVHRRIQHLVLPEVFHQNILTGGGHAAGLLELAEGVVGDVEKALDVYENNADAWKQLQHNAMTRDFSWDTASLAYVDLYKQLV